MDTAAERQGNTKALKQKERQNPEKSKEISWFKGLKAEFSKIIWPAKEKK